MRGSILRTLAGMVMAFGLALPTTDAGAGAAPPAPSALPNRLLYVIPGDAAGMLEVVPPELRPCADALREALIAAVRGEILARFETVTVVQSTAARDSQLAAALADRSLFNRYDDLVLARATLEGPGPTDAPCRLHATVVVTFRPWDPTDTLTLTGRSEGGGSGETPEAAARLALERAVRQVGDALTKRKARLVR